MTEYSAIGWREDEFWVVKILGVGATQGTSRADAEYMARDCVAISMEVPIEDVTVSITWREPVWDQMVNAALEIIRRDSGYPSIADMDKDMPVWRQQCEEIVTAALEALLGAVDSPVDDDGRRCPRCSPQNFCTLWCMDAMIAENTPAMVRELFALQREHERLKADSEAYHQLLRSQDKDLETAVGNAIMSNIDAGMPHVATAAILALFAHYETPYADDDHQGSNLLDLYIQLWQEFNLLNARRCLRYTCDHLETHHKDNGCERCSCPELTRTPTK